jgi:hypothetical protein
MRTPAKDIIYGAAWRFRENNMIKRPCTAEKSRLYMAFLLFIQFFSAMSYAGSEAPGKHMKNKNISSMSAFSRCGQLRFPVYTALIRRL